MKLGGRGSALQNGAITATSVLEKCIYTWLDMLLGPKMHSGHPTCFKMDLGPAALLSRTAVLHDAISACVPPLQLRTSVSGSVNHVYEMSAASAKAGRVSICNCKDTLERGRF
jgi:hypothetical protein